MPQPTALGACDFLRGGAAAATNHATPVTPSPPPRALPSRLLPLRFAGRSARSTTLLPRATTDGSIRLDETPPPYETTNGASRLDETSFLASLMPKKEIGADRFLKAHPEHDGRGVLIAIFDSGVDPAAAGLQITSDGKPKIVDILDCTGSGDVDTSEVVRADGDGCIKGKSGRTLVINPSWANPTGKWHIGCRLVYELFTEKLTDRLKKERKKKWDEKNQGLISGTLKLLNEFDEADNELEEISSKKARADLKNKLDFLKKQAMSYDDKGPIIDVVVWNDGNFWRVALDTQSLEDDAEKGKLADFLPMTNYSIERKYGVFSKLDACSFVTNIYNNGNLVSLVTDCSSHGTHVAGIAAAHHPEESVLNGVAPGAQLISCKIGDSRLGSKLTGTGLTRALIAAVKHKCDLINMSCGGTTIVPDYGRFIELVNEVVDKHKLVFISSVGNSGPALSTVRSPGGTTSSIIGVGAYVSLAMAAGAHCVIDPSFEGLEYTWSSRGPTVDGDLGVCLSAPGGAMATVPTWTLQRRMLRNGTSMSSPSACGGVALLISALKAEGIDVSPYSIRKALENTADSIGISQEDKLSTGQGLIQIDRALDYLLQSKNLPCICYKLKITQSGKGAPARRGIYLRESSSSQRTSEWTVLIEPKFHQDANNMEDLVPFEECIQLISSVEAAVKCPDYVLLTHNGRSFNIIVDPKQLPKGLNYCEVYGIDCRAPWRGPLFRVPITIIKPEAPMDLPPLISFSGLSFVPGKTVRKFIEVPRGATWAEATMRASVFDTARKFIINAVQICPLKRPIKWEHFATFTSPSHQCFFFPVTGGLTMELAIAQLWSSGSGSNEITLVDFEVVFHGITVSGDEVVLDGSEAPVRIDVKSELCSEKLVPAASLDKIRTPYRPVGCKINSLSPDRDKLPSGRQIMSLILTYKFKLDEGAEIKPYIPLLNYRLFDNKFESQFYMISDSNKRIYASGDTRPEFVKLSKGEYSLQLLIRHENILFLERLKQLIIFIDRKMDKKDVIQLSFFSNPDGPATGNCSFKSSVLIPGEPEAFFVGPPPNEKIPKKCPPGSFLLGRISYGKVSMIGKEERVEKPPRYYDILYIIPPPMINGVKDNYGSTSNTSAPQHVNDQVRDTKIRFLSKMKLKSKEERVAWNHLCSSLKLEYPRCTPLLSVILKCLVSGDAEDRNSDNREIVNTANEIIDSIDRDELANYFSKRYDPDSTSKEIKERMERMQEREQLIDALYQKAMALGNIELWKDNLPPERRESNETIEGCVLPSDDLLSPFESNFIELKKWVDVKSGKYGNVLVMLERMNGRLGTALKVLDDRIQDEPRPSQKLYKLKIKILDEMGWDHIASYERQWMQVRFPPCLPPL